MIVTRKLVISHSKEIANNVDLAAKEADIIYDLSIMTKLAHPRMTQFDLIKLIPGWRKSFNLTGNFHMHEMAAKQAHTAVTLFLRANTDKHNRRKRHKHQIRIGKREHYIRNKWTDPSSLLRRPGNDGRLHALTTRAAPTLHENGIVRLPGIGTVRLRSAMPDGMIKSFQMVDITGKITRRTTPRDRKFMLHVQVDVADPQPAVGKHAGMDRGINNLVAVSDSHGNERLYNLPSGCRRYKGDKVDRMRLEQSRHRPDSRAWKRRGRDIKRLQHRIACKQKNAEREIARRVTAGIAAMFTEGLRLDAMGRKGRTSAKRGLNRELKYARLGSIGAAIGWEMKKKNGLMLPVDPANTSRTCARCKIAEKESRDKEDFNCVFCGWYHHADTNAAGNIKVKGRPQLWTGGQAHDSGVVIADNEVVVRREDHGSCGSHANQGTSRLGLGNDDLGRSDRTPERGLGMQSYCINFYS